MIDEDLKRQILKSISYTGSANTEINLYVGSQCDPRQIIDFGSGRPRIHRSIIDKFDLELSQPKILSGYSNLEIRCSLCKRVISYPAWHLKVEYAVNRFHYFICFDSASPGKPSTRCYRRDV